MASTDSASYFAAWGSEVAIRNGATLFGDLIARITSSSGYPRDFLRIRGEDGVFEFENDVEITFPTTSGTLALLSDITGSAGTVTSVDVSGGGTGLGTTGGPITGSGTITINGILNLSSGGTGAITASGARSNLGLVIGTNVQAFDAGLLSLAALPTAADRYAYSTAADTWAEGTITTFGRSLLDDADAAAVISTLGLGALATAAYPGAGIPNSTGSAWGTSYTTTGTGTVVALQTSPAFTTPSLGVATGTSLNILLSGASIALPTDSVALFSNHSGANDASINIRSSSTGTPRLAFHKGNAETGALLNVASGSLATANSLRIGSTTGPTVALDVTGAAKVSTSLDVPKLANLTTNGFVKTSSGDGTLSVDTATYQPSDSELTALAGLTSAANKVPMFSGSGTATLLDFKDEDDMASNSATAVPSQQSVKAYVDNTRIVTYEGSVTTTPSTTKGYWWARDSAVTTFSNVRFATAAVTITVTALYVSCQTALSGGTVTIAFRNVTAGTEITATIANGGTSASTTGGSLAVTAGDKIEWSIVGSTALAANNFGASVQGKTS